jgi:hypothetical protein
MPGELELMLQALINPKAQQLPFLTAVMVLGVETLQKVQDSPTTTTNDTYFREVLADAPVAYWRLDEVSGSTAFDWAPPASYTNSGNNGTYTGGVTLAQPGALGDLDYAASFDGVTGYVVVPDAAPLRITGDLTIEVWVKPTGTMSGNKDLVVKAGPGGIAAPYKLRAFNNGLQPGFVTGNGSSQDVCTNGSFQFTPNNWYHVVGTKAGSLMSLYVNGALVATQTAATALADGGLNLVIGCDEGPIRFFAGVIDEVAVYNTALSAARVLAHYNARNGSPTDDNLTRGLAEVAS